MKARWLNSKLCATEKTYDYSNFREHPPRSILVRSPLNESTAVGGAYSLLSTVTCPLAEMGYYVYPVSVMDHFLKENGLPNAGEMHQIPLDKILEIIGADAVLYPPFNNTEPNTPYSSA